MCTNLAIERGPHIVGFLGIYPLVNEQFDPENHPVLVETNLPTPMTARVYVNLLEGICFFEMGL